MLCKPYIWKHPNRHLLEANRPLRRIRKRVLDYIDYIQHNHKQALTAFKRISASTFMYFLAVRPRARAASQNSGTWVILSKLRSGYSRRLNFYLFRLEPDIPCVCPECNEIPCDINHHLACPLTALFFFTLYQMNILIGAYEISKELWNKLAAQRHDTYVYICVSTWHLANFEYSVTYPS